MIKRLGLLSVIFALSVAPLAAANVAGKWNVTIKTSEGSITGFAAFKQDGHAVTGWVGPSETDPIRVTGTLQGNKLTLKTQPGFDPKTEDKGERRIYRWTSANLQPEKKEDTKAAKKKAEGADRPPAVQMTTFASWQDRMRDDTDVVDLRRRVERLRDEVQARVIDHVHDVQKRDGDKSGERNLLNGAAHHVPHGRTKGGMPILFYRLRRRRFQSTSMNTVPPSTEAG